MPDSIISKIADPQAQQPKKTMRNKVWLTTEDARRRLAYCPNTGRLTWKALRNTKRIGQEANCLDVGGYVQVNIAGTVFKGHQLAWLIHYGAWPSKHIDHINGDRADNRICNLREVTNSVNCQNKRSPLPRNKVGLLGVTYYAGAFRAAVMFKRKQHHLGRFDTAEEAHAAYVVAKRKLHEGCTI